MPHDLCALRNVARHPLSRATRHSEPRRRLCHRQRAAGSIKRVAAAVGEGAQVVAALHAYLARTGNHVAPAPAALP